MFHNFGKFSFPSIEKQIRTYQVIPRINSQFNSNFNWDHPSKRRKYFVEDSFSNASVCKDKKVKNDSRVESEAGKQHGQDGFHPLPLFSIFTNQKQHQIKAPQKRKCNK